MVSVSNITNNVNYNATNAVTRQATPSFRGAKQLETQAIEQVTKDFPKALKILNWIENKRGETINAIITAAGTAFIAPVFIALNPFSKEDKDTKTYSAWRQPISAAIALLMQLAITKKFEHYMDRIASTGQFKEANLKAAPADSYVRYLLKLQHPEYDEKTLSTEVEKFGMNAFKSEVNNARSKMQNTVITPEMLVGRKDFEEARKVITEELKDQIKELSPKDAREFIKQKSIERASEGILKKLEFSAEKKLRIREFLDNGCKSVEAAIAETNENLSQLPATLSAEQKHEQKILKAMLEQLENMKEYETLNGLKPFASIKNIGSTFEEILQNVKIKQTVQAGVENAKFSLKQYKVWYGMVVTLATLPFSCGLLNWSYPRIMEKIMPQAYKKKQCPPPLNEQEKEAKV